MATDLGNLQLGVQIAGLDALTNLENRLNALDRRRVNVDTSGATRGIQQMGGAADEAAAAFTALDAAAAAVVVGIAAVGVGFIAAAKSAISFNSTLEQATLRFTALTGSAATAGQMVQQINAIAASSVFGAPQLQQAASQLLAYGANASSIIPQIKAIATASAAAGGDLNDNFQRIAYVISELNSGIPLSERQIRQLGMAGVPIKALADQLGVTVEQLANAGKTGQVTSAQLVDAFTKVYTQGKYGDFMAAQTQTLSGALSLIRTNITQLLGTALQPVFQLVRDIAVKLGELAQSGQLQVWARQAQVVVQALIRTFESLISIVGTVAKGVASIFGVTLPSFSLGTSPATPRTTDQTEKAAAATNDLATKTQAWNGQLSTAADQNLARIKTQMDGIRDAQGDLTDKIADVRQGYEDQIAPLQKQLDAVNHLSQAEKDRQARLDELAGKEIAVKLSIPQDQVDAFDAQIQALKDKKDALGRFDPTDYDNLIRPLQQQGAAYGKTIQGLQDQLQDLAKPNTDSLDAQIGALQDAISGLNTDEFDRKINNIRDALAQPAPDTHGISNQLAALEGQLAGGQITQSAFDTQYGALSRQKAGINQTYQDNTSGLAGQLKLLEAQRADQALANQETRRADEQRIKDLQGQKKTIEETYQAQRDGIEKQITQQERLKRTVDDQAKVWETARSDAEKAFQANIQGIDDQIAHITRQRDDLLAPYNAALKQIEAERQILTLQQQQDDLKRKMAAAPITDQIAGLKKAEQDALDPLQRQQAALESQSRELEKQQRYWQGIADAIKKANDAAKGKGDQTSGAPTDDSRWGAFGNQAAPGTNALAEAIDTVNKKLQTLNTWLTEHVTPALTKLHDALINATDAVEGFANWLVPKLDGALAAVTVAGVKLTDWFDRTFASSLTNIKPLLTDVNKLLGDFSDIAVKLAIINLPGLEIAAKGISLVVGNLKDRLGELASAFNLLVTILEGTLHVALVNLHSILNGDVFNALGTFIDKLNNGAWKAVDDLATKITGDDGLMGALGTFKTWIENTWGGIGGKLSAPFTGAWKDIKGFFSDLGTGINWLASHFGLDSIILPTFSGGGDPVLGPPLPGHAAGLANSPTGHWAVVGEKGPEVRFVNKGDTIIPHDLSKSLGMLPGHADGLNLGFLDDLFGSLGGALSGTADRFAGALVDKLPSFSVPGLPDAATALLKQIRDGLGGWLATSPMNLVQSVISGVSGALSGGPNLPGMDATPGTGNWHNPVPGYRAVQGSWTHGGTHDHEAAVDWATPYGTPIFAPDSGLAYTVWNGDGATGRTGIIDHGNGWKTYYGHVSDWAQGGFAQDQTVGHTGSPDRDGGAGSGAHLHFAMRLNGAYERPEDYIPGIFGLADGGYFPGNDPHLAVIGEGREEIAAPTDMLREIVRTESAGGPPTFVFHPGAITVDQAGGVTVNPARIDLLAAHRATGGRG